MPIEPQSEDAIVARLMQRVPRRDASCMLAPLVVQPQGRLHRPRASGRAAKGYTQLRVDGKLLPVRPFPRIDRFKEHTIELPVGYVSVAPKTEPALRKAARARRSSSARAWCTSRPARTSRSISTKRACRSCGRSFPELDPRLFSYNSKHGWCAACYGTGLNIDEVDWADERARTGAEDHVLDSWIEWLEVDQACAACDGRRLNPEALAVRWRDKSIADYRRLADRCAEGHSSRNRS